MILKDEFTIAIYNLLPEGNRHLEIGNVNKIIKDNKTILITDNKINIEGKEFEYSVLDNIESLAKAFKTYFESI